MLFKFGMEGIPQSIPSSLSNDQVAPPFNIDPPTDADIIGFRATFVLVAIFLLLGLLGHAPWKQDETYVFGIVYHFLNSDNWLVPILAGEPFMEKPPLFYWVAAAFARFFSPWMPLHDGARLAVGFFMAITCGATGWVAHFLWGSGHGRVAVLLMLGCFGMCLPAHMMAADVPLLTGFAIAVCGIALAPQQAAVGGFLLGTGAGVGFLAKGIIAPGVLGLTWTLLWICFRGWRNREFLLASGIALLAAGPWLLVWPIALYLRSHILFMDWFWVNNIGRYVGFSVALLGSANEPGFWSRSIPWFTFPALPVALLTLWRFRYQGSDKAPFQICVTMSVVLITVLCLSATARANYLLPLLVPLCILAAPAALRMNAASDKLIAWCAGVSCAVVVVFIWGVWIVMSVRGFPPDLPIIYQRLPLNFVPNFNAGTFTLAVALTLAAPITVWTLRNRKARGVTTWLVGLTLVWGLLSTLWLPWIDEAKSYRSVFLALKSNLVDNYHCINGTDLGESERAMLHYVANTITQDTRHSGTSNCEYWLYQGFANSPPKNVDSKSWILIWDGSRPADTRERFWLYKSKPELLTTRRWNGRMR